MTEPLFFAHTGSTKPCAICGYFGSHVHTTEDAERIRNHTADELISNLHHQQLLDLFDE